MHAYAMLGVCLAVAAAGGLSIGRTDPSGPLRRGDVSHRSDEQSLTVRNIRLEPAAGADIATLRFDLHNEASLSATDIVLQITVLDSEDEREGSARSIIAGPFTVRAKVVLSPRFSMEYEMTLPRISSPCRCLPTVAVVSARWIETRQA